MKRSFQRSVFSDSAKSRGRNVGFISRFVLLDFYHYDFYAQALSKLYPSSDLLDFQFQIFFPVH